MEGILYITTGRSYINQAIISARSIKQHSPTIPIAIMTDDDNNLNELGLFTHIRVIQKKSTDNLKTFDKVTYISESPFDKTLFLDSDTFVLEDISNVFSLLDRFDIVFTFAHYRKSAYEIYDKGGKIEKYIPSAFPIFQSGVMLYNKSNAVKKLFYDFLSIYEKKGFFYDQVSLREAIWTNDLRFGVLPEEYNFSSIEFLSKGKKSKIASPKIFHYHPHKNKNIEELVSLHYIT